MYRVAGLSLDRLSALPSQRIEAYLRAPLNPEVIHDSQVPTDVKEKNLLFLFVSFLFFLINICSLHCSLFYPFSFLKSFFFPQAR